MNYGLGVARRGELGGVVKWKAVCHGSQALGLGGDIRRAHLIESKRVRVSAAIHMLRRIEERL